MLSVTSSVLELRGVANKVSKKGTPFYIINVEDYVGTPYALYCPNFDAIPQGLKKGDNVVVTFDVRSYQGQDNLSVTAVRKVEE